MQVPYLTQLCKKERFGHEKELTFEKKKTLKQLPKLLFII